MPSTHGLTAASHTGAGAIEDAVRLQVVLAPHIYGPTVTHAAWGGAGAQLFERLSSSFGWAMLPSAPSLLSVRMPTCAVPSAPSQVNLSCGRCSTVLQKPLHRALNRTAWMTSCTLGTGVVGGDKVFPVAIGEFGSHFEEVHITWHLSHDLHLSLQGRSLHSYCNKVHGR